MSTSPVSLRQSQAVAAASRVGKLLATAEAGLSVLDLPATQEDFRALVFATGDVYAAEPRGKWGPEEAALLTRLPSSRSEAERAASIEQAMEAAPDRRAIVGLIAMLLDGYPSGRPPNLEAYADTIVHDLCSIGFSAAVVAMGCRILRRRSRFLPAVAEVIEAATEARDQFRSAATSASMIARRIAVLEKRRETEAAPRRFSQACKPGSADV